MSVQAMKTCTSEGCLCNFFRGRTADGAPAVACRYCQIRRSVVAVQALARQRAARQRFLRMRGAAVLLQAAWRGHAVRRRALAQHRAATVIQVSTCCVMSAAGAI